MPHAPHLADIRLHPIKSLDGVSVQQARIGIGGGLDLDRAWASAYVEETMIGTLRLNQGAQVLTDSGQTVPGRITFIAPRAEFTPRNVQTADERARLVYRVTVSVDNREGILKPGMPVEVRWQNQ